MASAPLWFLFVVGLLCVGVVAVLVSGLIVMARGGALDKKYSNLLMRWRVGLQLAVIIVFASVMMMAR